MKQGHFREGKVGGWRDVMTEETVALYDAKTAELEKSCGLVLRIP